MGRVIRAILLSGLGLLVSSVSGKAEAGHRHCPPYYVGGVCGPCVVERTVMVPQTVMEHRTVHVTQYRCEPRHEVVAYTRMVPEVHTYKKPVTVMTQVARQRTVPYTVMKPVCREVEYEVVVNVPHVEVRHGVRMCTKYVPTTEHRIVHEDHGHYEERVVESPICEPVYGYACGPRLRHRRCGWNCDPYCGLSVCVDGCAVASCQTVHRVWVPQVVERTIDVVVHRPVCVEEKYEYQVVVCRPERRVHKKLVTEYVPVTAERVETYFECVPEVREMVYHQTVCKPVVEHRTVTRMVTVPYVVEKVVAVPVCRMVPRRVVCSVPVCGPVYGPGCGSYWGPNWWCYP